MNKRLFSLLIVAVVTTAVVLVGLFKLPMKENTPAGADGDAGAAGNTEAENEPALDAESVYIWYSDDSLTNYINGAAVEYNDRNDTRIVPVLTSSVEYLEAINKSTIESNTPDLYVLSHDSLTKAYLGGLAKPISMDEDTFEQSYIGQAKNSVSYQNMLLGYPLSFETTVFLYNETFLRDMAIQMLDKENPDPVPEEGEETASGDGSASASSETSSSSTTSSGTSSSSTTSSDGETGEDETEDNERYSDQEIKDKIQEILPKTVEDIKTIGDSFDAPEGVESFMDWDVNDVFFNYFFIGDSIVLGGDEGWDTTNINIYNENAIASLEAFQQLNQFFSVDSENCDYDDVIQEFIDGKIIFTVATSDAIGRIEQAKADGTFAYDYGVTMIPDMSDTIDTRSLSITNCVVINPFSSHENIAEDFAKFMTIEYASLLYSRSGKISVAAYTDYDYGAFSIYALEYGYSMPLPKMMQTSNFWVELEAVFSDVWDGDDANARLKKLAEKMVYQVRGEETTLPVIIPATTEEEEEEYIDEDEARAAAQAEE